MAQHKRKAAFVDVAQVKERQITEGVIQ